MTQGERPASPEEAKVVTGDTMVQTEDQMVQTTDDVVETTSDVVEPSVVTMEAAVRALSERFGPLLDAEYVPGKTAFRDALAETLQVSELDAEELCDELERAGRIAFIRIGESFGWHVHAEGRA